MALQIPSYAQPRGYEPIDIAKRFQDSYDWGQGVAAENDAQKVLADYGASLYGKPSSSMSLAALAPAQAADRMIAGEHASATAATDPTLAAYFANTAGRESGGSNAAKNPNSSATGKYQFLTATWDGLMQQHPELGLTPDGRNDPAQQDKAMMAFTIDNAKALKSSGVPVNPATLYAAHFLGAQGASDVLKLPDNTPMAAAVSPDVIQANPQLQNMTVADFKAWTAQNGGNAQGGYAPPAAQPADLMGGQSGAQPIAADASAPTGLPPRDVMIALLRNPETRSFAGTLITAQRNGTGITEVQKNYAQAVAQGYRGTLLDYQKELKTGGVTVNTGDNSSKFQNKADETAAGRMSDYVSAGNDAANFLGDLKALTDIGKNITTGKKTELLNTLGPWAEALGVKIEGLDDAQAYDAIISRMAPQMRPPGSGASSDFDARQFLKSLPSLGNTPEGNQIISDVFQGLQERKVKAAQIANDALSGKIQWQEADRQIAALGDPYTAFKDWQKSSGGGSLTRLDDSQPPASYDGDPSLWKYMTPEQKKLWQ